MSKIFRVNSTPKFKVKSFIVSKFKPIKIKGHPSSEGKCEEQIVEEILEYLNLKKMTYWILDIKGKPFLRKSGFKLRKNENKGFADILINFYGLFITFEVKKCGGMWSVSQQEFDEKVDKSFGVYRIVSSVQEVKEFFDNYTKLDYVKNWLNQIKKELNDKNK